MLQRLESPPTTAESDTLFGEAVGCHVKGTGSVQSSPASLASFSSGYRARDWLHVEEG